ncbi:MAG: CDP-alcohol phosphatidyltransferase family protein [Bryobacteraceae bacterium]|nr:CDP-alcohol phosphatidyltransferase family protein [Bryobacteraceae bacterium]
MLRHLPNLISVSRFILTPFAVHAILAREDVLAFWLCLTAGATDFLDGGLARRFGAVSKLGALLDPAADKFMLDAIYLAFWMARDFTPGLLVIGRDLMIVLGALALFAAARVKEFPPTRLGKISTVVQIAWVLIALHPWGAPLRPAATWALIALTAASGFDYVRVGWRLYRHPRHR